MRNAGAMFTTHEECNGYSFTIRFLDPKSDTSNEAVRYWIDTRSYFANGGYVRVNVMQKAKSGRIFDSFFTAQTIEDALNSIRHKERL